MEELDVKVRYTTIHIPQALASIIDDLIRSGEFAYSSRSEFVKDALRRHLTEHGFYPKHSAFRLERSALSIDSDFLNTNEERVKLREALITRINMLREFVKSIEEVPVEDSFIEPKVESPSKVSTKAKMQK